MSSSGRTTRTFSESPSNFQLITDALCDYINQTGVDLSQNLFAERLQLCNTPDAILELLQERENVFIKYREGNRFNRTLINCLSPAVRILHVFSETLREALPFPPAKAIFIGIDVLINVTPFKAVLNQIPFDAGVCQAASEVTASYDAVLDLFECLGNFLKRLDLYTNIPPTQIMTDIIVKIMVELLSVLSLATKQIKRGRFRTFAKKLLGDSDIEAVLRRLDRLTQDEARVTVAQTLSVVHGLVSNMKVVMEDGKASMENIQQALVALHQVVFEINKMKRDQLQRDVQHWLSPPDPSANHDFVWKAHHEGTAAWFFESDVVVNWKSAGSLLWIHGKPGSGKSTLLSAIIQHVEGLRAAGLATMAYYYCDFRDVKKQNLYGLLSSLLSQLSAESDACYEVLSLLRSKNAGGTRKPITTALTMCMKDMLSLPEQGQIYIIIDALDECPNNSETPSARDQVLELVEELVCLNLPNVHLCVTSRPEVDIRSMLEPLTSLQISLHDERGQKDDIINYIKSFVHSDRNMRKWREQDQQLVINELSEKADGMFRYVVCQVERLRRSFPASIRGILNDLPKSLDETYSHTLLDIDEEKREYAQRLFQCLIVSIRPLRIEELSEIFSVGLDDAGFPTFDPDWRPADADEAVLSACSSLISVVNTAGSKIVQFSHFSVKEYLTSERVANAEGPLSCYYILPECAHTTLARACLSVLLHLDDKVNRNAIRHLPLAQYAAQYWIDHARFGNVSSQVQDMMERLFDLSKPHFAAWVWLYDCDHHWLEPMSEMHPTRPSGTPLYYGSLCGLHDLVEHFIIARPQDINAIGGFFDTPLQAASARGCLEIVQLLLNNNSDPNLCNGEGTAPLHAASYCGHVEVAKTLLDHGADVKQKKFKGWTPLHFASNNGRLDVARLLIERGAVVDECCYDQKTPLYWAASGGKLELVQLLLNAGATVNSTDADGWTPLHRAAFRGYHDITDLLLKSGASLDGRNKAQETPLIIACRGGRTKVSQMLLARDPDVNSWDKNGSTPLHFASQYGYLDITQLLLDRGADVDPCQENIPSPLHGASANGHLQVTKLLLQHGANVDSRDSRGETPLHKASGNGHLEVARILVEGGADVSSRDDEGWTLLHKASENGHLPTIKFLLGCGINLNVDIRNENGKTPLCLASGSGKLDAVGFLLEKGANIHTRDNNGWHPLHVASQNGHLPIIKVLLDCGMGVDIRNGNEETPLYLASGGGKLDVMRFLIEKGADIHTRNDDGWNPLHVASQKGHLNIVRLMINAGTPVDIKNGAQSTPLILASCKGSVEVSRFLIERGAGMNARDNNSWAPLHFASHHGHVDLTRLLLDRGVDPNIQKDDLKSPLHLATANGHIKVAQVLIQRGATVDVFDDEQQTPLGRAAGDGEIEVLHLLLDNGANLHTTDSNGQTPLHAASRSGHLEVVKLLLRRGAGIDLLDQSHKTAAELALENDKAEVASFLTKYQVDANVRNSVHSATLDLALHDEHKDGKDEKPISLHIASKEGNVDVVKSLLDLGADIQTPNANRETPLEAAADAGKLEVVRLLLDRGAEVDRRDKLGWTPLHCASRNGHVEVLQVLINHGANVNARTCDYWTPLHLSAHNGELKVVELLLECGVNTHALNFDGRTAYQVSLQQGHRKVTDILREHDKHGAGRIRS